jgi:hypothetical protein
MGYDSYSEYLHKEEAKKLSGTDRWIYHRLRALGFRWLNSYSKEGERTMVWLWLPPEKHHQFDPCHLTVEIGRGAVNEIVFRPRLQCSVHVKRYLTLCKKSEWKNLESFINFYRKHEYVLYEEA